MRHSTLRELLTRPVVLLAALVMALLGLTPGVARAETADQAKGKSYVIATDTTFAPFEFRDASGQLTGIDMDIIREVAKRQGFTVDIQSLGFDAALQAVTSGQANGVIAGMSITDKRKATFDFSDPYFGSGIQMAVKASDNAIKGYADLKGKTVVAKTGTEGLAFAESIAGQYGFKVKALAAADTMYAEVNTGNAVAVFDDFPVLNYGITQGNGLKTVTAKEAGASYGFAVAKGKNPELLAAFNAGLASMRLDGSYADIVAKYLGEQPGLRPGKDPAVVGKTFVIATDTTFAPFEFRDPGGNLIGIDMDLIRQVASRKGFTVDIQSLGFNAALQAVTSGQANGVIAGMSITEERKKTFDFSEPYFESGVQMAVKASDDTIKSYADLKGKTVVAKTGAEGLRFAQSIAAQNGFTVKALDQADTMYAEVNSGNAVAVFDDYPVLAYGIKQGNGLKTVTPKEPGGSYGFAVAKGKNAELLNAFNTGLAELRSDGTYQQILDKYLISESATAQESFWGLLGASLPALLRGMGMTVLATLASLAFASVLGLVFGFFKVSGNLVLKWLANIYVDIFRGTPLLVQAFFFYFGIPSVTGQRIDIFWAGVLTLSLNAGAYMTEIVRGGVQSVDVGQMEASRSLGMNWMQSMTRVVAPQAIKIVTPSVINQFVITLKDTSLLAVLGLAELTYQGQQIIARNFRSFEMWLIVGALYFIVIMLLTKLSNVLDRRFNK